MRTNSRKPSHPGEILKELYLDELNISITDFAGAISVSRKAISAIVNGHKSVTPEMAMRFARAFDNTSPEFWMSLQQGHDLWMARQSVGNRVESIHSLKHSFA